MYITSYRYKEARGTVMLSLNGLFKEAFCLLPWAATYAPFSCIICSLLAFFRLMLLRLCVRSLTSCLNQKKNTTVHRRQFGDCFVRFCSLIG